MADHGTVLARREAGAVRFFFYGTLLDGSDNPVAARAHRKLRALGPATVTGELHAVPDPQGWYPALLTGTGAVRGLVYESGGRFGAADLARLDAYEDCDPANPGGSLYLRVEVEAAMAGGGTCPAQVYLYNRSLPAGSRPIAAGDFRSWLARNRAGAFGGRHGA